MDVKPPPPLVIGSLHPGQNGGNMVGESFPESHTPLLTSKTWVLVQFVLQDWDS